LADESPQRYPEEFLAEARELVHAIVVDVLALDEQGETADPAVLNRVFRAAHSLKGLAGMFGAQSVAGLAHALEDLLDALRLGRERLTRDVLDLLFDVPAALESLLASQPLAGGADTLTHRLRAAAGPATRAPLPPPPYELPREVQSVLSEYEIFRLHEAARRGHHVLGLRREMRIETLEEEMAATRTELGAFGEVVSAVPTGASDPLCIAFHVLVASELTAGELAQALDQPIEAYPRVAPSPAKEAEPAAIHAAPTSTVRVDIAHLDALLHTVGELRVSAQNLMRIAEHLQAEARLTSHGLDLAREVRTLTRRVRTLREGVLSARLVPLAPLFARLARVIRGIARDAGKEVTLATSGVETELDKLLVEQISDPLVHLLRNAVDHGIEPVEDRVARGKPPRGQVTVEARSEGNRVVIGIHDDGAGVDPARVRDVAVSRGLLTRAQVDALDDAQVLRVLFFPGFTTRALPNEVSGRGVGLDVVRTNITRLSGTIDVTTRPGSGTSFTLTLPVTLAILPALVVRVAGEPIALPLRAVAETLLAPAVANEALALRGRLVASADLAAALGFGRSSAAAAADARPGIVTQGDEPVVYFVDEILGQRDVVVKPLGSLVGDVRAVAGVAEIGSDELALVVDLAAL
jgi:two-component system chemotaxis sensor kinase CheA